MTTAAVRLLLLPLLLAPLVGFDGVAQQPAEPLVPEQTDAADEGDVAFGLALTLRGERLDNLEASDLAHEAVAGGSLGRTRVRPRLRARLDDAIALEAEGQWYMQEGAGELTLYQAIVSHSWEGRVPARLRLGRQELAFGSQFLLGADSFFDGLAFDAARITLEPTACLSVDVFGGRFVPSLAGGERGSLFGVWAALAAPWDLDLYALHHTSRVGERFSSLGVRAVLPLGPGVALEIEPVHQRGSVRKDAGGARLEAWGGQANLRVAVGRGPLQRLTLAYAVGSGTSGRGDIERSFRNPTHDTGLLGDIGVVPDLAGFEAGAARASGLSALSLGATADVARSVDLAVRIHRFRARHAGKADSRDIGREIDATATWSITDGTSVSVSVNRFLPGAFFAHDGPHCPATLTFVQLETRL